MRLVWDDTKNRTNRAKHHVSFETASLVFADPFHVSVLDRVENCEERWQTLGMVGGIVVLLVAHTFAEQGGEEVVRIISARKATRKERQRYEEGH
ncbi:BrnT family toxin [Geobacter sp.]|uniref:BrnT family toxin n=1 Tax=Geobacter sp. TaxID=46610 RepID=UPI001ACCBCD0|nr:BrnT family toxin [Geobacter sp.]CAG0945287.1 hypothetical protein ANRL1_02232 [Anaerolineae bacterium]